MPVWFSLLATVEAEKGASIQQVLYFSGSAVQLLVSGLCSGLHLLLRQMKAGREFFEHLHYFVRSAVQLLTAYSQIDVYVVTLAAQNYRTTIRKGELDAAPSSQQVTKRAAAIPILLMCLVVYSMVAAMELAELVTMLTTCLLQLVLQ